MAAVVVMVVVVVRGYGSAATKPTKCTSMIFSVHTQAGPINEDKSLGCSGQIMPVFFIPYSFCIT